MKYINLDAHAVGEAQSADLALVPTIAQTDLYVWNRMPHAPSKIMAGHRADPFTGARQIVIRMSHGGPSAEQTIQFRAIAGDAPGSYKVLLVLTLVKTGDARPYVRQNPAGGTEFTAAQMLDYLADKQPGQQLNGFSNAERMPDAQQQPELHWASVRPRLLAPPPAPKRPILHLPSDRTKGPSNWQLRGNSPDTAGRRARRFAL